ncbi:MULTISPECIES: flagellar basal-body rod protein FlgF [Oceanicaulis]|uniref:flagellar basal-body rod protein FlgF n=1 Tax=Oceanicaulis TaxID=153232 RepID=UPI0003B67D79|nr:MULTISPECIES: flagellar basal-body rod protein FlgF [Oceanicaulis]HCR67147.1 flagellar basal-body rod protein FlgF [Oceanicaulis sp.]|tara:strand:- start:1993 stop:2727 length:735 start_codon:yes stop_codon:yes gene_type:complete
MDNTMLIGLTRQLTLRRQMDVVANNIANANTQGFKAERMMLEPDTSYRARHQDGPNRAQFVDEWAMGRDFSQGSLTNTGRPLDLALQGDGFFMVEMDGVERFTRDGAFTLNPLGELVASDGAQVLDAGGAPIVLDPTAGQIVIGETGEITQNGQIIAQVGVAQFADPGLLTKTGDNRYAAPEDAERVIEELPQIKQGFLESSNVRPMLEITTMMEVSRAYASVTRMIKDTDELSRKAIDRLGRP